MCSKNNGKKHSYRERQGIAYQQNDPPFLAQIKSKLGYKEWKVEDKFSKNDHEGEEDDPSEDRDDIRNMLDEERPQVVVVDPKTDLTADELQIEIERKKEEEDRRKIQEGKIVFRKPEKRNLDKTAVYEGATERAETGKKTRVDNDK